MRFLSMIISMGALMWVLFQMAGGDDADGIIPQEHIQSMEKAKGVEQTVQDAAAQRLKDIDKVDP